jgi:hypothetical protein
MPNSAFQQSTALESEQTGDNDFNDFEEDEMTRRIREEEEQFQVRLREKSVPMMRIRRENGRINSNANNKADCNSRTSIHARNSKKMTELQKTYDVKTKTEKNYPS